MAQLHSPVDGAELTDMALPPRPDQVQVPSAARLQRGLPTRRAARDEWLHILDEPLHGLHCQPMHASNVKHAVAPLGEGLDRILLHGLVSIWHPE